MRFDDLSERPEGDPLAVGQTTPLAPPDDLLLSVDERLELRDQPCLPDAGLAGHRHELQRRVAQRTRIGVLQQRQLVLATDEGGVGATLDVDAEAAARTRCAPERQRLGLAFDGYRLELVVDDHVACRAKRRVADDDRADRRRRLEARGRVDDVAGGDSLPLFGTGVEGNDRLARRDGATHGELQFVLLVQVLDRVEDLQRGAHGAIRIVLVRGRRAEDGHDRVADELLDRAAEVLDLLFHARVIRTERRAHILGIGAIGARGEADEVDEQDRDDLSLLGGGARRLREPRAA